MPAYRGITVLAAAAAALAFVTAPALAGPGKKTSTPAQPIPYDQLNSKTPKAKTGVKADTSATVSDSATTTAGSDVVTTATTPSPSTMGATSPTTVNPAMDRGTPPTGMGSVESTTTPGEPGQPPK